VAPLEGIRVVEAASYISGPWATGILADLGADVLKIEPPTGDPFRKFGRPVTAYAPAFANVNRGKRSVALDLKTDEGVAALLAHVRDADVFLSNWRPEVADRLGVGDDVLAAENPRLIRLWMTGFGPDGPRANDSAYDTVVQGAAALPHLISRTGDHELMPGYHVDKISATMAAQSVLAALVQRARTNDGQRIDLAMLDAIAYFDWPDLMAMRVFVDHQPDEARNLHATAQMTLPASDGWFVIAAVTGRDIKNSCAVFGHPEWAAEVFALDHAGMTRRLNELYSTLAPTRTVDEWIALLNDADVAAARCLSIDEHLSDAQVVHNELYRVEDWPAGRARSVRYPAVSREWGGQLWPGPPPDLPGQTGS
jgi:crotonobetainyl-CoA:carnitine CoA-transferase CaiB-like acyl-CoA transferase